MCRPCRGAGAGGAFAPERSVRFRRDGLGRGRAFHGSPLPFARARPSFGLCAAVGAACRRARRAGGRGGTRTRLGPPAAPVPATCRTPALLRGLRRPASSRDRLARHGCFGLEEAPGQERGVLVGACLLRAASVSRRPGIPGALREPLGPGWPRCPRGGKGREESGSPPWGARLPFPPPSLSSRNRGRVSSAWR